MFNYDFVFPPPEQLETRRQQLNNAGFQAWLTPLVIILAISFARVALRIVNPQIIDITTLKAARKLPSKPPDAMTALSRKVAWILSTNYVPEFGPLYVQVIGVLYASWLVYLAFSNTGNDYLHLTKQFSHVAVSQLPWQYLLVFKSPRSPFTLATGLTHERLNALHRLLGRIVHAMVACHAVLYFNFFVKMNLLEKRGKHRDVRLGIIAFWSFNLLGLLSIPPVRRKVYHAVFYRSHVVLTAVLPVVLWFHQPWTRWYLAQAGVFYLANGFTRSRNSTLASAKIEAVAGKDLLKIIIQTRRESEVKEQWVPGQHIYLRGKSRPIGPKNPFTIVDVQGKEKGASQITLVVRHLGGPGTRRLAPPKQREDRVNGKVLENSPAELVIEGPYGEASQYLPQLLREGRNGGQILFVAGGVGATYILPIYIALLKARHGTDEMNMIWFVKSEADARWGVEILLEQSQHTKNVDVYITQPSATDTAKLTNKTKMYGVRVNSTGCRPDLATVIEPVMAPKVDRDGNERLMDEGKRSLKKIKKNYEPVTVLICGPPGLSQSLRKEVGKHVLGYGREVRWYEEQFGFGGS